MRNFLLRTGVALAAFTFAAPAFADETSDAIGVVIMSRHGVRTSLMSPESEQRYAKREWPKWDVPRGHLTAHGYRVMSLFGRYYGEYLRAEGLLAAGNEDAAKTYFRANVLERTISTTKALAEGIYPGVKPVVDDFTEKGGARHSTGQDPIFDPESYTTFAPYDAAALFADAEAQVPGARAESMRPAMKAIFHVLGEPAEAGKAPWWKAHSHFKPDDKGLPVYSGPITRASGAVDAWFMQYLEGKPAAEVAWGKVGPDELARFSAPHIAAFSMWGHGRGVVMSRREYSTMGDRIIATLESMNTGKPAPGALGKPGDKLVIIGGHDSTIHGLCTMFGFRHFAPDGLAEDEILPGSALMFELRRDRKTGRKFVRTLFLCQTMDQIRNELPVTLKTPPYRCPMAVRGTHPTGPGLDQSWEDFEKNARASLDPEMILKP